MYAPANASQKVTKLKSSLSLFCIKINHKASWLKLRSNFVIFYGLKLPRFYLFSVDEFIELYSEHWSKRGIDLNDDRCKMVYIWSTDVQIWVFIILETSLCEKTILAIKKFFLSITKLETSDNSCLFSYLFCANSVFIF